VLLDALFIAGGGYVMRRTPTAGLSPG